MTILDEAIIYAVQMHSGMTRKGSTTPYIVHPMEAAAIVATMTDDPEVIAAAVLHDVVEDTPATIGDIREKFGERIASFVGQESENKREDLPPKETWKIRKQETIDHLNSPGCSREVKMIALGDKLSNIRAMSRDYEAVGDELWQRFNVKDKKMHEWYYESLVKALSELREYAAWREYAALVQRAFH